MRWHAGVHDAGDQIYPDGYIGYVGVRHGVSLDGEQMFSAHAHLHGGPAPVPSIN
jgi:hypothetical protein